MPKIIIELKESDKRYPKLLQNLYDRPKSIYALGNIENLNKKSIAIIGSRECTSYGRKIAQLISYIYAKKGYIIVSGLARGIDASAHIGALLANGKTIAVLGTGLNKIYPYENTQLARKIISSNGTIISEYSLNDKIKRDNFAYRNRIISGLCSDVIVVEAKEKSGALITAEYALQQGKNVYAIPGNVNNPNSSGTNSLIKDGAKILLF